MITMTERAASALETFLAQSDAKPGQGVKLIPAGETGIGMVVEAPAMGDEVIRRGDVPLLIVDRTIRSALDRVQIDCDEETADGRTRARLKLRRPAHERGIDS